MDKSQDYPWRESHAYFAGYDDGIAGTDALRSTWSDWPEAYERGRVAGSAAAIGELTAADYAKSLGTTLYELAGVQEDIERGEGE